MKYRVLGSVALAAVVAFARPVSYLAQESGKAAEVLALARKAIAGGRIDSLKTFSVESAVQRNVATMQLNSDVEIYVELPDKYARVENSSGGPGLVVAGGGVSGFNGEQSLQRVAANGMAGGMVIRMGGAPAPVPAEKPTPEQIEQMRKASLRSARTEASRLMLGWFAMAHPAAQATYTYVGEAESVEGKAYVVDVKNGDGLAARLFIDEQSNLPLMVTYQAAQPRMITQTMSAPAGGHGASPSTAAAAADVQKQMQDLQNQPPQMSDYTIYFEDWRSAEGVKFPFKLRRATGGNTTEEWTVSKIRLNPKIDAKKFAVDSGS